MSTQYPSSISELNKMRIEQLIELAQNLDIFVWHDSTKPDLVEALKQRLFFGKDVWCC